jgi:hypothetical protein
VSIRRAKFSDRRSPNVEKAMKNWTERARKEDG